MVDFWTEDTSHTPNHITKFTMVAMKHIREEVELLDYIGLDKRRGEIVWDQNNVKVQQKGGLWKWGKWIN